MQSISTQQAPNPVGSYPHARRVGNLLFLSGSGPRAAGTDASDPRVPGLSLDKNGNFMAFDFAAQVHQVMANVAAVLQASGADWQDVVDVTVFLTNMQRDFHTFNQIYAEYMAHLDPKPCRTTVEVTALPTAIAIELKCIAVVPEKGS